MRGNRRARMLAGPAVVAALAFAAPAGATITAVPNTNAGALSAIQAAAGPGFTVATDNAFFVPRAPMNSPVGIATALPGFPRDGKTFLILSTGDATAADDPDQAVPFPNFDDGGGLIRDRGDTALDVTAMQINYASARSAAGGPVDACLSFDYRFLSEEYPSRLSSPYADAFIAESLGSSWTTMGPTISAPTTFTFGANNPVTIKSASLSPAEASGTPYSAATALLHAQILVPAQTATTTQLYLSIFDQNDRMYDSAVFIDNIRLTTPPGTCSSGSTPLGPAIAITAPAIGTTVATATPTLTGTAGNGTGDATTVTVRIYSGPVAAGAPVQTLAAPRSGTTWSVITGALAPGQYTAQATQANAQANGVSAPATFTVPQPQQQPPAGGGSTPQGGNSQAPGDKDNDGIPDDQDTSDGSLPPVPGKSFDARVVSGTVFIKYPAGQGPRAATPPKGFVPLKGAANVPMGSQLDTSRGRVALTSAADTGGAKTQTADFYDGIFQVKQTLPRKKPKKAASLVTDLVLKGAAAIAVRAAQGRCPRGGQEEGAEGRAGQPVGQRQGQVPHERQVQLGDGPRHDLVDPGSLRWDVDHREARRRQR